MRVYHCTCDSQSRVNSFFKLPKHEVDPAQVDCAVGSICRPRSWVHAVASQSLEPCGKLNRSTRDCGNIQPGDYGASRLKICCDSCGYLMVRVYHMWYAGGVNRFFNYSKSQLREDDLAQVDFSSWVNLSKCKLWSELNGRHYAAWWDELRRYKQHQNLASDNEDSSQREVLVKFTCFKWAKVKDLEPLHVPKMVELNCLKIYWSCFKLKDYNLEVRDWTWTWIRKIKRDWFWGLGNSKANRTNQRTNQSTNLHHFRYTCVIPNSFAWPTKTCKIEVDL